MRTWKALGATMAISVAVCLAASARAAEKPRPPARPPPPASAERYGAPTSYHATPSGKGYSAQSRHMADCLATYRSYNPETDRFVPRPGVTRRCEL